jgi:DNA-binding MarR family transcriptional regulator
VTPEPAADRETSDGPGTGAPAAASDAIEALETALTALIRRANLPRTHDWLLKRAQAPLERAAYMTLARLADLAPSRLGTVSEALGVDASTASRQVSALERDGLVERTTDPDDGRASLLAITPGGAQTLDLLRVARRQALAELVADWSPEDIRAFGDLAARFARELATISDSSTS